MPQQYMEFRHTASYANSRHNFLITGIPAGRPPEDELLNSFTAVILNILQRSPAVRPSEYIREKLGEIPFSPGKENTPLWFLGPDNYVPEWHGTIKGNENGYKPAAEFFYELWPRYLQKYSRMRQLILPEAPFDVILEGGAGEDSWETGDNEWRNHSVDFYLPSARLVIEIDGIQHKKNSEKALDKKRDNALNRQGITVIRIEVKDIREQSEKLRLGFQKIKTILDQNEEYQYNGRSIPENDPAYNARCQYETVMRYEIAVLRLIQMGCLDFRQPCWRFNIDAEDRDLFRIAAEDVFLWYRNLYALKGMEFRAPKQDIGSRGLRISNSFGRRDETTLPDGVSIFTDYWDDRDYYRVSCAELIDYGVGQAFDEQRHEAMRFFIRNLFGFPDFREGQAAIVAGALNLKRLIGILPTGGGKSFCYQICSILQPAVSFSVCPLVSLIIDQKRTMDEKGFRRTACITGLQNRGEKEAVMNRLASGRLQMVWISPERFQIQEFRTALGLVNEKYTLAYAVLDEVHCLSEWGHDFRTSYLCLVPTIERYCPHAAILGLTATASNAVLRDLKIELNLDSTGIRAIPSLDRPELTMRVYNTQNKYSVLQNLIEDKDTMICPENAGIIFANVRDKSDDPKAGRKAYKMKEFIRSGYPDFSCGIFRSDLEPEVKTGVQQDFIDNKIRLLSSTKAFGMGIDKPDIRYTIHFDLPWSVESFYQEAGRAGRDREPSQCFVIFRPETEKKQDVVNTLFGQYTSAEEIADIIDGKSKVKIENDLRTIFYLWKLGKHGVPHDVADIMEVFRRCSRMVPKQGRVSLLTTEHEQRDKDKEYGKYLVKADTELALYRLKLMGIVDDWTISWRGSLTEYSVALSGKTEDEDILESTLRYIRRYNPGFAAPWHSIDENYRKMLEEDSEHSVPERCAKMLVSWTYDHIIYSHRQMTQTILNYLLEYDPERPELFKKRISGYLAITERSVLLDKLIDNPPEWEEFSVLFSDVIHETEADENGRNVRRLLTPNGFSALWDMLRRYQESFRDSYALNLLSVLSAAIGGRWNGALDGDLLKHTLLHMREQYPKIQCADILELFRISECYYSDIDDDIRSEIAMVIDAVFPGQSEQIGTVWQDSYSLSRELGAISARINRALAEVLGDGI